jgi:hypothetical protein
MWGIPLVNSDSLFLKTNSSLDEAIVSFQKLKEIASFHFNFACIGEISHVRLRHHEISVLYKCHAPSDHTSGANFVGGGATMLGCEYFTVRNINYSFVRVSLQGQIIPISSSVEALSNNVGS